MLDFSFISNERVAELRAEGKLAISRNACRLSAILGSLVYLIIQLINIDFKALFLITDVQILKNQYLKLFEIFISYLAIYVLIFIATALIQSRFYFSFSQLFRKNRSFFSLSELASVFSLSSLIKLLFIVSAFILLSYMWLSFVPQAVMLYFSEDYSQALDNIFVQIKQLSGIYSLIVVFIVMTLIFIAKLVFRLDNDNHSKNK